MFVLLFPNQANATVARLQSIHLTLEDITRVAQEKDFLWVKARAYNPNTDRGKIGELIPLGRHLSWVDGEWMVMRGMELGE